MGGRGGSSNATKGGNNNQNFKSGRNVRIPQSRSQLNTDTIRQMASDADNRTFAILPNEAQKIEQITRIGDKITVDISDRYGDKKSTFTKTGKNQWKEEYLVDGNKQWDTTISTRNLISPQAVTTLDAYNKRDKNRITFTKANKK